MRGEAELPDEGVEETSPLSVVGFGDVELNRDMGFDVDGLKNCRAGRVGLDGGLGRDRAGVAGVGVDIEERILLGVHDAGEVGGRGKGRSDCAS